MAKWTPWVGLWYDQVWNAVVPYDRDESDSISIRRGKTDESSAPVPTSITLTLPNRDGRFTPDNPMGALFGKIGRNTPLQVCSSAPIVEDFEDTSYLFTFTMLGTGSWARSSVQAYRGSWSFKSPTLADGQTSYLRVTVPAGVTSVSFWLWCDIFSQSFAAVYTSEGLQWFDGGQMPYWQLVTVDVGTSTYVEIAYIRNGSAGAESLYIDDLRGFDARGTGEVYEWSPDSSEDFDPVTGRGDAWCKVTAGGLLHRIGQATDVTDSPIYRSVFRNSLARYSALIPPVAYWPMEDPEGVAGAAEASGGEPMTPVTAVRYTLPDGSVLAPGGLPRFRNDDGIPGSGPLVGFVDGGTLRGVVPPMDPGSYGIDFVIRCNPKADEGGTTSADIFRWYETGTYVAYTVNITSSGIDVFHANAADWATLASTGSAHAGVNPYDGAPHHVRYQIVQSGGNYLARLYIDGNLWDTADNFATPGVMAGTVGRPTALEWNPLEDRGDYMPVAAGHLIVWPLGQGQPNTFTPTFGSPNEQGGRRLLRFGAEEGWPVTLRDRRVQTDTVGPQLPAPMPELLRDIERTEDGILYDQRGAIALVLRTRQSMYGRDSMLDLVYGTDALQPIKPTYDDAGTRNEVTARNRDGQQVLAAVTSGPFANVSPLAGGVGRYPWTADVNTNGGPARLTDIAWWWANKGIVPGARYRRVVIDLDADPTLELEVARLDLGDRLRISGLSYDLVDVRLMGIQERYGGRRRLVSLLLEPFRQFDVAYYWPEATPVNTFTKRYGSRTSTLSTGYAAGAVSLVISFTALADQWSQVNEPYDLEIAGERITVTSMGAVSGSGPYTQTATVTRAVNGVVKAQVSGAAVQMHSAQLARYAL